MMSSYHGRRRIGRVLIGLVISAWLLPGLVEAGGSSSYSGYVTQAGYNGVSLELTGVQGKCAVRIDDGPRRTLDVAAPCGFKRAISHDTAKAQSFAFEGVGRVFLVAGPALPPDAYPPSQRDRVEYKCTDQVQAVIVDQGAVRIRPRDQFEEPGVCHEGALDKKDYYMYACEVPDESPHCN